MSLVADGREIHAGDCHYDNYGKNSYCHRNDHRTSR